MDNNRTPEKIEEAEEKTAVTESTETTETAVTEEKKPGKGKAKKIILAIVAVILALAGIAALIYTIYWETQKSKAKKYLEGKIFITDEYRWSYEEENEANRDLYSFKDGYIAIENWEAKDDIRGDITTHDAKYRIKKDLFASCMSIQKYDNGWKHVTEIKIDKIENVVPFSVAHSWQRTTLEEIEQIRKEYSCEHKRTTEKSITKATCTESGEAEKTCLECGYVEKFTEEALGHDYKNNKCRLCGQAEPVNNSSSGKSTMDSDTWYVYDNAVMIQNCEPTAAVFMKKYQGYNVTYRPVCKKCHKMGQLEMELVTRTSSLYDSYVCNGCNTKTNIKIEVVN